MPRIVATVTNDLTYDQRMIRCCSALVEAGYDVTLVGRSLPDSVPVVKRPFDQVRLECDKRSGPGFYAEYNIRLRSWLHSVDYDLAIACDLDTIMAAGVVSRQKGVPFVYDAHEYFTEVPELVGRPLVKAVWRAIARRYVPRAAACYTVGDQLSKLLSKEYGVSFGVVRNVPVRSDAGIRSYDERRRIILYQGALNEGRGIEVAIDAIKHFDDLTLVLAGEGDLSHELRKRAVDRGVEDRVEFLGRVKPEDLAALTSRALIGLNLLENRGLSYYYSLANKFFDYIQAGTPSLNMDFPEYSAIASDYQVGILLPDLREEHLVSAISRLRQREIWNACNSACSLAGEEFHWDVDKKVLIDLIKDVMR